MINCCSMEIKYSNCFFTLHKFIVLLFFDERAPLPFLIIKYVK